MPVSNPIYGTKQWAQLSKWVREHYNHKCCLCGEKADQADHILPVSTHPHLALVSSNLRLLCRSCHAAAGTSFGRNSTKQGKIKKRISKDGTHSEWLK